MGSSKPLLYSLGGFRYCNLLLAGAERTAWRWPAGTSADDAEADIEGTAGPAAACAEVARRARQTLQRADDNRAALLDFALNHLTLARAALAQDRLQGRPPGPEARAQAERALENACAPQPARTTSPAAC